ncbi:MAG: hypothetical protein K6E31_02805 [bacterium]|nr:hypothetical protein [bacterium]
MTMRQTEKMVSLDPQALTAEQKAKPKRRYMRAVDAREYLGGVSSSAFWSWVQQGRLAPGKRLSSHFVVWDVEDLDRFVRESEDASEPSKTWGQNNIEELIAKKKAVQALEDCEGGDAA